MIFNTPSYTFFKGILPNDLLKISSKNARVISTDLKKILKKRHFLKYWTNLSIQIIPLQFLKLPREQMIDARERTYDCSYEGLRTYLRQRS